jgi:LmbE family N-acetylglucosaminyl deacetylase
VLVDITPVMDDKLQAAKSHQSQTVLLDEEETNRFFELLGRVNAGSSGARHAEPFYRLM